VGHFWVVLFADTLLALDRLFQRRIQSIVPHYQELWDDPAGFLARQQVVIRPRRRYAVATVLGGSVGFLFPCAFALARLDHPRVGPVPWYEPALSIAFVIGAPLIGIGLFWHWLRGGEMVLRAEGVVLRYRADRVLCPWAVFEIHGEAQPLGADRWLVPFWQTAIPAVVHVRGDTVVATGRAVRTRQLYFRAGGQLILRDLYAVRFGQIADLLLHLGQLLGPETPLAPPPESGDTIPEGMF
jgi:hypothetical protein